MAGCSVRRGEADVRVEEGERGEEDSE